MSISSLNAILNWKLLPGSHNWPGPDGGTCINEAAIVVAGLPYKAITNERDLPPCFSKVLGGYLLCLNDDLGDQSRQRLIEFAPRLSGSADAENIEEARYQHLYLEMTKRILPMVMETVSLTKEASAFRALTNFSDACKLIIKVSTTISNLYNKHNQKNDAQSLMFAHKLGYIMDVINPLQFKDNSQGLGVVVYSAKKVHQVCKGLENYSSAMINYKEKLIDDYCIEMLRTAFLIGNQASPVETNTILNRVKKIKEHQNADT